MWSVQPPFSILSKETSGPRWVHDFDFLACASVKKKMDVWWSGTYGFSSFPWSAFWCSTDSEVVTRSSEISSELKRSDLQRNRTQALCTMKKYLLFETKNDWSTVWPVNNGGVRIKQERSMKPSKSTNLKHLNSLQPSVRRSLGSVICPTCTAAPLIGSMRRKVPGFYC